MLDFKNIHIGSLIKLKVDEQDIEISRICKFLKTSEYEIEQMYKAKVINTEVLLRWSKLLEYDFFRIYSQHLILYAPPTKSLRTGKTNSTLPIFRKNIYTKEIVDFIIELINTGEKTKEQVISEYQIPKTTLYKWISKYKKHEA